MLLTTHTVVDTNLPKCVVLIDTNSNIVVDKQPPHKFPPKNTFPLNFPYVDWVPSTGEVDFVGDVG